MYAEKLCKDMAMPPDCSGGLKSLYGSCTSFSLFTIRRTATRLNNLIIGANLSEPHTSGTALQDTCVCMLAAIYQKIKLNERIRTFQICTSAEAHNGSLIHYLTTR